MNNNCHMYMIIIVMAIIIAIILIIHIIIKAWDVWVNVT